MQRCSIGPSSACPSLTYMALSLPCQQHRHVRAGQRDHRSTKSDVSARSPRADPLSATCTSVQWSPSNRHHPRHRIPGSSRVSATAQPPSTPPQEDHDEQAANSSSSNNTSSKNDDANQKRNSRHSNDGQGQQQHASRTRSSSSSSSSSRMWSPFSIDDPQLLVGDCVALVAAALYRQLAAIVTSPDFPGWLAPLHLNPIRFGEFANFAAMLVAAWVVAATLTGGYSGAAVGAGVPAALRAACRAWLVAMPICAAHLVLVTASESQALVGDEGFAGVLPLVASGPGEPLGTAAALLGLMAMWRAFYAAHLDTWALASARDVSEDAARFREALASVALVAAGCNLMLQLLQLPSALAEGGVDGLGPLGSF